MIKNGTYTFKSTSGAEFIMTYKNDTLNGPFFIYNNKKELREVGDFSKGFRNGTQKGYDTNGLLLTEKKFNKGKIESIDFFTPNGNIYFQEFYNDSVLVKTAELYKGILHPNNVADSKKKVYKEGYIKSYTDIKEW